MYQKHKIEFLYYAKNIFTFTDFGNWDFIFDFLNDLSVVTFHYFWFSKLMIFMEY